MNGPEDKLREQLMRMLLDGTNVVPSSTTSRLGRTALTILKTGRLIRKARKKGRSAEAAPENLEQLAGIVSSIGRLKGIAMKMGQIMSYIDVSIPEELRTALSVLQTHAQPMDFERVREIIREELPDRAGELLAHMGKVPMAAASIGQVHRAVLDDGTPVAVKVQYPEIEKAIRSDFRPAALGTKTASLLLPYARIDSFVREVRTRFLEECDYVHEAKAQERFMRIYDGHPVVVVPAVHSAYCSRRVFTSTWIDGLHFEEYLKSGPSQEDRNRIGSALFEFYIGTLFRHGIYNCDPHPGNYIFQPDGRMALLDYGCTLTFKPDFLEKIAALSRAVQQDDRGDLHRAFVDLGMVSPDRNYDFETARGLVRSFYGPMLRDETQVIVLNEISDMRSVMNTKLELLKLTIPGEFVFLFRIRFGLMSVLSRLGSRANWYRLESRCIDSVKNNEPMT